MNAAHKKLFEKKYGTTANAADQQLDTSFPDQNTLSYDHNEHHPQQSAYQPVSTNPDSHLNDITQKIAAYNSFKLAVRTSSDYFPSKKQLEKTLAIPLAVMIQPFASVYSYEEFPTVDFGENHTTVRCDKCRAYVNPFTEFVNNGHQFKCNLCNSLTPTPYFYSVRTDSNGQRLDKTDRSELYCGTYDIKAGKEYMARPPSHSIYLFILDVSQKAVENGSLQMFSNVIIEIIDNNLFWGDTQTKIGFLAYDSNVHIFNLDNRLKRPQLVTLGDMDNLTQLPIPGNLLVKLHDHKEAIKLLITALPTMFSGTNDDGSCLYNAVRVGNGILKPTGGRMYIIQSNPNIVGESGLTIKGPQNFQDKKILMVPATSKLTDLTADMEQNSISCSIFVFSNEYRNTVTIAELARYLNGDIHYLPQSPERNHKFYFESKNSLMREYTWESAVRLRVSEEWGVSQIYGNYSRKQGQDLLSIPNCDDSKALLYQLELKGATAKSNVLYMQSALLYTSSYGERRIRVINYAVPLTDNVREIERTVDPQVVFAWILRTNLDQIYKLQNIKTMMAECHVTSRKIFTHALKYKEKGVSIPEPMITFSLGLLGLFKHPLFQEDHWQHNVDTDMRNALRIKLNSLNIEETMLHFIPYLFAVHRLIEDGDVACYDENGNFVYPQLMNLSASALSNTGIYLMDDGCALIMFIGSKVDPGILRNLFGVSSVDEVESFNEDMLYYNASDPLVERLYNLITELRVRKVDRYSYLYVVKEGEKSQKETEFYSKLIEDTSKIPRTYKMSYNDFMKTLAMPVIGDDKM